MNQTRKRKRQYCGHCDNILSHAAYYDHKKNLSRNGVWFKDPIEVVSAIRMNNDGLDTIHGKKWIFLLNYYVFVIFLYALPNKL